MSYFKVFIGIVAVYFVLFTGIFLVAGTVIHFVFPALTWGAVVLGAMACAGIAGLWKAVRADYGDGDVWFD